MRGPRALARGGRQKRHAVLKKIANNILMTVRRFGRQESGPTALEYAALLGIIVVVIGFSVSRLARGLNELSEQISDAVGQVVEDGGEGKGKGKGRGKGNRGGDDD